jgi:hypothetical protein
VAEPRWKRHERLVARALSGERQPNIGRRAPDVLSPSWAIEVKTRRSLPRWLLTAIAQAEEGARATGRLPLVVLVHAPGQGRRARRFALMPLEALASWRDDGARKCAEKCGKGAEKCREMQTNAGKIPEGQLRGCSMGV